MLRTLRAETLKAWKRPALWVCLAILVVLMVGLGYGLSYFIYTYTKPPRPSANVPPLNYALLKQSLYPSHFHQTVMSGAAQLGGVLMMIIGVLLQGSEYGWGTVKTAFTQHPRRRQVILGRLVIVAVIAFLAAVLLLVIGALVSWLLAAIDGKAGAFPLPGAATIGKAGLALTLIFFFWAVFGFALATLFRQSALAIGLGLAYALVIESLIFGLADQFVGDPSRRIHQWFPLENTAFLVSSFGTSAPREAVGQAASRSFADGTHGAVMLLLYCAAFVIVSLVLTDRRDVAT